MELTDKCKEAFDKWNSEKNYGIYKFEDFNDSMQYGVYIDFFDETDVDLDIDIIYNTVKSFPENNNRKEIRFKTIISANKIFNLLTEYNVSKRSNQNTKRI